MIVVVLRIQADQIFFVYTSHRIGVYRMLMMIKRMLRQYMLADKRSELWSSPRNVITNSSTYSLVCPCYRAPRVHHS